MVEDIGFGTAHRYQKHTSLRQEDDDQRMTDKLAPEKMK